MIAILKLTIEDLDYIVEKSMGMAVEVDFEELKKYYENSFVLKKEENILGFGYYIEENLNGVLKDVIVFAEDEIERVQYEDMLIRSMLNAAERKGLKEMLIKSTNNKKLFENIGFESKGNEMKLDLSKFFSMKCGCSKS